MDAVEVLHDHIDMMKLLEYFDFDRIKQEGRMIRSCCKLHGGNNPTSFVINTDNKLWYCHTGGCGGGDAYTLVQRIEEISFTDAVKWVAEFFQVDISTLDIQERKQTYLKEMKAWIKTIESRRKKEVKPYEIQAEVKQVTKFRTFLPETLEHFRLGWVERVTLEKKEEDEHGNKQFYTLRNRLVFPIDQNGVQVGASFRRVKSTDVPKWSHQPKNIETGELLYNYDHAIGKKEVTLVEGIPDVWAYHEIGVTAIGMFGAHVTEEQYKLIMRLGCDLVLSFDGDEAGRVATEKAKELFKYKCNISVIPFDAHEDPDNIDRNQLKLKYESRIRV